MLFNHRIGVIDKQPPGSELEALLAELHDPTVTVTIEGSPALARTLAYMFQASVKKNIFAADKLPEEVRVKIVVRV